jgi:hypothetical protein
MLILPPKFLIGNTKAETMLCFDLFEETKMRKTKWFCKQMKTTFLDEFE